MKKSLHRHPLYIKTQISIGNAKIEKIKTWPLFKIIIDQGHVFGNTNFSPGRQICVFMRSQCFFLRLKITIIFFKQRTPIKNHSVSIYEKRQHLCDLRKESWAHGAAGRPILKKTDHFSYYSRKKQNHFVKLILGFVTMFQVSKCTI